MVAESAEQIAKDVAAVGRIDAAPRILRLLCQTTGMGFAVIARVSDFSWTACAVQDDIDFGLKPGGQLDLNTTLCKEAREAMCPVVIEEVCTDPVYIDHQTPRLYGFQSYISVPIVLPDGTYFGNLCAIDPKPAKISGPHTVELFKLFAELVSAQLGNERRQEQETTGLLEAVELREQLIAVLGHDLRNPLAAVTASAHLLERSTDQQTQKFARAIVGSCKRMAGLIESALDLARGRRAGGFDVEFAGVDDLAVALEAVVVELQSAHPGRNFQSDIQFSGPIFCDRGRIQQLASNLLGNAIAHGATDGVVQLSALGDDHGFLLSVTNTGVPIPPENLDKIFSPFWRNPASSHTAGLGLGLFICSQIVKAHGGTLEVVSSFQDGTTFAARLPRQSSLADAVKRKTNSHEDISTGK